MPMSAGSTLRDAAGRRPADRPRQAAPGVRDPRSRRRPRRGDARHRPRAVRRDDRRHRCRPPRPRAPPAAAPTLCRSTCFTPAATRWAGRSGSVGLTPMAITWSAETREFHLRNERISYVLRVHENGSLGQLHFGPALAPGRSYSHLVPGALQGLREPRRRACRRSNTRRPASGDYRVPALDVRHADGSTVLDLRLREPPDPPRQAGARRRAGLPATYVEDDAEADTLEITLVDAPSGLTVELRYTIFARPPGRRPQRPHPQRRHRHGPTRRPR